MLCDVFRKLAAFDPVETYRYVGFGSVWFSDFVLFHRALGIRDMLSIEQAVASRERFEANKPFAINIDFRPSTLVLPEMLYDRRQFIWLDYDDTISTEMLHDVATIAARASSGTVLVVSVQCMRAPDLAEAERARLTDPESLSGEERFRQRLGPDRVPAELNREDLFGWSFGALSRDMFYAEIERSLETRRLSDSPNSVSYRQICDFEYEDGAKMTTLALAFFKDEEENKLNACRFDNLEFLNPDGKPVYIPTPKLTLREFRHLESQLPLPEGEDLNIGHIPVGEARGFASMYRYLPNFAVVES